MKPIHSVFALLVATTKLAGAASISLNVSENDTNQSWLTPATPVGPLGTSSDNFNTTNSPTGGSGSLPVRSGTRRASLAGVIIEEVPEPSGTLLTTLAGMLLFLQRQR